LSTGKLGIHARKDVCCVTVYINNTSLMDIVNAIPIGLKSWLCEKETCSYAPLLKELKENNPDEFKDYLRMD
jgi:hypothetical protein